MVQYQLTIQHRAGFRRVVCTTRTFVKTGFSPRQMQSNVLRFHHSAEPEEPEAVLSVPVKVDTLRGSQPRES